MVEGGDLRRIDPGDPGEDGIELAPAGAGRRQDGGGGDIASCGAGGVDDLEARLNSSIGRLDLRGREIADAPAPCGVPLPHGEAELIGDPAEGIDIGAVQPGAAAVIGNAIGLAIGMRAPADTIPRLDRLHGEAALDQGAGRGKPGRAGADHHCIQHRHQL